VRAGNEEGAAAFARVLKRHSGTAERINEVWANAYVERGSNLMSNGKDGEATAVFARALERDPGTAKSIDEVMVSAYVVRGTKFLGEGSDEEATAVFARALDRDPGAAKRIANAYNERALGLFFENKARDGLNDAEKAVALAPDNGAVLSTR